MGKTQSVGPLAILHTIYRDCRRNGVKLVSKSAGIWIKLTFLAMLYVNYIANARERCPAGFAQRKWTVSNRIVSSAPHAKIQASRVSHLLSVAASSVKNELS